MATAKQAAGTALGEVRARRAELHRAILQVELALARPGARPDWFAGVSAALARLRLAFDDHVAVTEGRGGLYEQILAEAPRLEGAVRRLRGEHLELDRGLSSAGAKLREACRGSARPVEDIRRALVPLLGRLVVHRQRGADLLYEAYEVDVGGSADLGWPSSATTP